MANDEDPMMLTDTVSSTGIFLQFLVKNELEKWNSKIRDKSEMWDSQIEYPIRLSPFFKNPKELPPGFPQNSTQKQTPEEMIQYLNSCQIQTESEETRIDLVSSSNKIIDTPSKKVKFTLCIECKKLEPDYATWIFFKTKDTGRMNLISKNKKNEGYLKLMEIRGADQKSDKIWIQIMQKWKLKPTTHVLCDSSVAVNKKETEKGRKNREFYKKDFDKIDNAARQIIKGTYGFLLDKLNQQIITVKEDYNFDNIIYFPIIVTTADLRIGNFNEDEIGLVAAS